MDLSAPRLSNFPRLALSFLFLVIIALSLPTAQSKREDGMVIRQIVDKEGGDICAGVAAPASCPINCFRADPVCGVDGVTYWCGCADAMCKGVAVAKLGPCELGNGGSASLPHQALLLVHILWLILLGFSLLFGLF